MTRPPDRVLVLTPLKDAARHLDGYFAALDRLTFPAAHLSLGFLESDSRDDTFDRVVARLPDLRRRYRRANAWKRDFGFRIPPGFRRWAPAIQVPRRTVLARSRNHLLFRALDDEDWVLWIDVDVFEYPPDVVERLLATGKDVLHPHCVKAYGGPTFDLNGWRDGGRTHMDALRGAGDLVRLDAVGGSMLLVRADVHRDGLVFPPFLYGLASPALRGPSTWDPQTTGAPESEGLGLMARDMGYQCWGMPNLEVLHRDE
jgi:GT2 family glycosyltransferase